MSEELIQKIEKADSEQIQVFLDAVTARYRELYPQEEVFLFSLPRNDPRERRRLIRIIKAMLE